MTAKTIVDKFIEYDCTNKSVVTISEAREYLEAHSEYRGFNKADDDARLKGKIVASVDDSSHKDLVYQAPYYDNRVIVLGLEANEGYREIRVYEDGMWKYVKTGGVAK